MAKVTFYGASDDLVEVEGIEGADEFSPEKDGWVGVLESPDGDTALVYVDYRHNGTWTVSLGIYEEDYLLPAWPITTEVRPDLCRYSTHVTVEVPDGTTIKEVR